MNQDELDALIKEGKTIDEILSIRGESAEELLSEKRSVVIPTDAIEDALLDDYSHPQLVGLLKAILNFSRGNYEYIPAEKIPNSVRKNLMNFIADNNDKYLLAHVKQSVKGAQGGRPKKGKRPKPTAFNENPQQATETHGLPRKAIYVNVYANEDANVDVCSSSKENKGVGEEEKSPYLPQQSQETPVETQSPLEQPQQSQPTEETQSPLATPQQPQPTEQSPLEQPQPAVQPLPWDNPQPVVPQVKLPVRPQSPLATPQPAAQNPQPIEQGFPQQMAQTEQPQQMNYFGVNPAYIPSTEELPF